MNICKVFIGKILLVCILVTQCTLPMAPVQRSVQEASQLSPGLLAGTLSPVVPEIAVAPVIDSEITFAKKYLDEILNLTDDFVDIGNDIADANEKSVSWFSRFLDTLFNGPITSLLIGGLLWFIAQYLDKTFIPAHLAEYVHYIIEYGIPLIGTLISMYCQYRSENYVNQKLDLLGQNQEKMEKLVGVLKSKLESEDAKSISNLSGVVSNFTLLVKRKKISIDDLLSQAKKIDLEKRTRLFLKLLLRIKNNHPKLYQEYRQPIESLLGEIRTLNKSVMPYAAIHKKDNEDEEDTESEEQRDTPSQEVAVIQAKEPNSAQRSVLEVITPHIEKDYDVLGPLGQGGYGNVFLVKRKSDQKLLAMKVLETKSEKMLEREQTLAQLHHPNIINYSHSQTLDTNHTLIFTEYFTPTSLRDALREWDLSELDRLFILCEILQGINYLHNVHIIGNNGNNGNGILHRDLKPENILIKRVEHGFIVKIIDFGLVKIDMAGKSTTYYSGPVGTAGYMASEVLGGAKHTFSSDIYSFGFLAVMDVLKDLVRTNPSINDLARELEDSIIYTNPRTRPSAHTLLELMQSKLFAIIEASLNSKDKEQKSQTIETIVAWMMSGSTFVLPDHILETLIKLLDANSINFDLEEKMATVLEMHKKKGKEKIITSAIETIFDKRGVKAFSNYPFLRLCLAFIPVKTEQFLRKQLFANGHEHHLTILHHLIELSKRQPLDLSDHELGLMYYWIFEEYETGLDYIMNTDSIDDFTQSISYLLVHDVESAYRTFTHLLKNAHNKDAMVGAILEIISSFSKKQRQIVMEDFARSIKTIAIELSEKTKKQVIKVIGKKPAQKIGLSVSTLSLWDKIVIKYNVRWLNKNRTVYSNYKTHAKLRSYGKKIIPYMIPLLKSDNLTKRLNALFVLYLENERAIDQYVVPLLEDKNSEIRKIASFVLEYSGWIPENGKERVAYYLALSQIPTDCEMGGCFKNTQSIFFENTLIDQKKIETLQTYLSDTSCMYHEAMNHRYHIEGKQIWLDAMGDDYRKRKLEGSLLVDVPSDKDFIEYLSDDKAPFYGYAAIVCGVRKIEGAFDELNHNLNNHSRSMLEIAQTVWALGELQNEKAIFQIMEHLGVVVNQHMFDVEIKALSKIIGVTLPERYVKNLRDNLMHTRKSFTQVLEQYVREKGNNELSSLDALKIFCEVSNYNENSFWLLLELLVHKNPAYQEFAREELLKNPIALALYCYKSEKAMGRGFVLYRSALAKYSKKEKLEELLLDTIPTLSDVENRINIESLEYYQSKNDFSEHFDITNLNKELVFLYTMYMLVENSDIQELIKKRFVTFLSKLRLDQQKKVIESLLYFYSNRNSVELVAADNSPYYSQVKDLVERQETMHVNTQRFQDIEKKSTLLMKFLNDQTKQKENSLVAKVLQEQYELIPESSKVLFATLLCEINPQAGVDLVMKKLLYGDEKNVSIHDYYQVLCKEELYPIIEKWISKEKKKYEANVVMQSLLSLMFSFNGWHIDKKIEYAKLEIELSPKKYKTDLEYTNAIFELIKTQGIETYIRIVLSHNSYYSPIRMFRDSVHYFSQEQDEKETMERYAKKYLLDYSSSSPEKIILALYLLGKIGEFDKENTSYGQMILTLFDEKFGDSAIACWAFSRVTVEDSAEKLLCLLRTHLSSIFCTRSITQLLSELQDFRIISELEETVRNAPNKESQEMIQEVINVTQGREQGLVEQLIFADDKEREDYNREYIVPIMIRGNLSAQINAVERRIKKIKEAA